jgi:hypothetical protein
LCVDDDCLAGVTCRASLTAATIARVNNVRQDASVRSGVSQRYWSARPASTETGQFIAFRPAR